MFDQSFPVRPFQNPGGVPWAWRRTNKGGRKSSCLILDLYRILDNLLIQRNKKVSAAPLPFYSSELVNRLKFYTIYLIKRSCISWLFKRCKATRKGSYLETPINSLGSGRWEKENGRRRSTRKVLALELAMSGLGLPQDRSAFFIVEEFYRLYRNLLKNFEGKPLWQGFYSFYLAFHKLKIT